MIETPNSSNASSSEVKMPMVPAGSPMAGKSLNLGKLDSKDSQTEYLKKRRSLPIPIQILKYISILALCIVLGAFFWLKADLDVQNKYLKVVGVQENIYRKHANLELRNNALVAKTTKIENDIEKYRKKLANKQFYEQQEEINKIRESQSIQWFDEILPDGERKLGVFDSFKKMENYFSSSDYKTTEGEDGKIQGPQILSRNNIEIENIVIDRNHASFSVEASNLFGKVFFLSSEFVEMMNSFDFFKDGTLTTYSRQKIDGTTGMSFTLDLKMQAPGEVDPMDEKFSEFTDWESRVQEDFAFEEKTNSPKPPKHPRPKRN